jgi:hypothetical protein
LQPVSDQALLVEDLFAGLGQRILGFVFQLKRFERGFAVFLFIKLGSVFGKDALAVGQFEFLPAAALERLIFVLLPDFEAEDAGEDAFAVRRTLLGELVRLAL